MRWTLRSSRVVLPGGLKPAAIHINDEVIARVAGFNEIDGTLVNAGNSVIMPGLVDTHVHINDPGRADCAAQCYCRRPARRDKASPSGTLTRPVL